MIVINEATYRSMTKKDFNNYNPEATSGKVQMLVLSDDTEVEIALTEWEDDRTGINEYEAIVMYDDYSVMMYSSIFDTKRELNNAHSKILKIIEGSVTKDEMRKKLTRSLLFEN